ncbi:MAG: hypothetical protein A2046_03355 [Bacteroidetes bacterium GWA2_30_7]|nr:MAG: hypothetical protein A2046_03355 [Bacteroidetes bacterium GWA2_30_7]
MFVTVKAFYGQQPFKLVDDSNKWYEFGQLGGWGYYDLQLVRLTYFFDGDTTINGYLYKKLFYDKRDTIYSDPPYIQDSYGYAAAFRQDSLKVYFVKPDSTIENLYCDFNMSIGDTLKYYYNNEYPYAITSIDSIQYGNNYRKEYKLNNSYSFYEGIGNGLGLFHDFSIGIEGGVYLVCFEQNEILQNVYQFWGTPPECGLTTNLIKEKHLKSNNISIFPNPFSETAVIEFPNPDYSSYNLVVTDVTGKVVKQISNIKSNKIVFEKGDLSGGFYLINMKGNKIFNGNLIIK